MSRWVFDIETDHLLQKCTRMWILSAYNLDTEEMHYWEEGDLGWQEVFNNAKMVAGHNILGFDVFALKKLFNYDFPKTCTLHDTLILSQVLNYNRFMSVNGANLGHSLERWGEYFKYPKYHFDDWSQYSEEMKDYCLQDTRLTVKVYKHLINEFKKNKERNPLIADYIRVEHAVAKWCSMAALHGWPFDVKAASDLKEKLETEMDKVYQALSSKLGSKVVIVDKLPNSQDMKDRSIPKRMKYNKNGMYESRMAAFFGIDPVEGLLEDHEKTIVFGGEFSRIKIEPLSLSSSNDVKVFLYRNGWVPTEWNYKKDKEGKFIYENVNGKKQRVKTSPKITEDSLELLGGDGKLYPEYLTAKSRHGILKTWLDEVDEKGMLHGDCFTIGTPSMRARHSIIVNVPSADSPWGKEMRSLFTTMPGWKLIGCDSAGNQARGLAHYLADESFTNTLINGDIHQFNADVLTKVLLKMGVVHTVPRSVAKRILYAFLFGASGGKLWSYVFGSIDDENGKKLKTGFTKAVPGFKNLLEKLESTYSKTSEISSNGGYIYSLAGNKIYVDSFHKLLVYLLQAAEKITCGAAVMLTMQRLEEENIPYIPCIMMHDEEDFLVPEEYAEKAAAIGKQAFIDGPKMFGVEIMDGDAKIGNTWYEVH